MKKSSLELRNIVAAGGGVVVNAEDYSSLELRNISSATKTGGGKLIIRHALRLSSLECRSIAAAGDGGHVVFNFTD